MTAKEENKIREAIKYDRDTLYKFPLKNWIRKQILLRINQNKKLLIINSKNQTK